MLAFKIRFIFAPNFLPMLFRYSFLLLLLFICTLVVAQNKSGLVSGPMLGYAEHREVLLWVEVAPTVKEVEVVYSAKRYHSLGGQTLYV